MKYTVEAGEENRLDRYLAELYPEESRTSVAGWVKDGHVLVNGNLAKPNRKLQSGDIVSVEEPEPVVTTYEPEEIPLEIVYQDEWIAVIDKAPGMVVHPAPGISSGTLVNALLFHMKDDLSTVGGSKRPGIVHRLDKDTAGLLVVAKDDETHRKLSDALQKREIVREYSVLVYGRFTEDEGEVDFPIGRSRTDNGKMAVNGRAARDAKTRYTVLERFDNATYLRCALETGRTHQIRVHMQAIGHPILGDTLYGIKKEKYNLPYQMLHATHLTFTHPQTGETLDLQSEPTAPFLRMLDVLRDREKLEEES